MDIFLSHLRCSAQAISHLHKYLVWSLIITSNHSIIIYASRRSQWTLCLPHLGKYCGNYSYSNLGNVRRHSHASVVPPHCPLVCWVLFQGNAPSNCHIFKLTPLIDVFMSIVEFGRHKQFIFYVSTLMNSSLHGWEALSMPRAFTHSRNT